MRTAASLVFLHDYWILVPEAIATLEERESALSIADMLGEELKEKNTLLARLQAEGVGGREKRVVQTQMAIAQLQVGLASTVHANLMLTS